EDFLAGAAVAKIIDPSKIGELLLGRGGRGAVGLGGDVGLARNTEGMSAADKVRILGLDYQPDYKSYDGNPYVTHDPVTGAVTVSKEAEARLFQLDTTLTPEMVARAKIPMGPDLEAAALAQAKD